MDNLVLLLLGQENLGFADDTLLLGEDFLFRSLRLGFLNWGLSWGVFLSRLGLKAAQELLKEWLAFGQELLNERLVFGQFSFNE